MDPFENAKKVKLSNCHGKYLWAKEDKRTVIQSRRSDSDNAIWEVRRVMIDNNSNNNNNSYDNKTRIEAHGIRLRSCFGCYLTGSLQPFLLGMTGRKVIQTNPTRSDDLCVWYPEQFGALVKLKTREGSMLRANAGAPPWRNSVTHDIPIVPDTVDVLWAVKIVELADDLGSRL